MSDEQTIERPRPGLSRRDFVRSTATVAAAAGLSAVGVRLARGQGKKVLTLAHGGVPENLHPHSISQPVIDVVSQIFDGLADLSRDLKLVPSLAERWEVREGFKWRFSLRKGVVFHNDEKFTAQNVKYTVEYTQDPATKDAHATFWKGIVVDVVNDYTVDVYQENRKPHPLIPNLFFYTPMLPIEYSKKVGADEFSKAPIGTGLYRMAEWKRGEYVKLEAFDRHWRGKPKIDTVYIRSIPEPATRVAGLKEGSLDVIVFPPAEQLASLGSTPGLAVATQPSVYNMQLTLRSDVPPFKDNLALRKAVAHAINGEDIVGKVLLGHATLLGQAVGADIFGYNPELKPYKYDPALAKASLKESGYKGEEIVIQSSNGRYFKDVEINQTVEAYLQQIGVNAKITIVDWPTWMGKFRNKKVDNVCLIGWTPTTNDAWESLSKFAYSKSPYAWWNGHPGLDEQFEIAGSTLDVEVRRQALQKALRHLHESYLFALTYQPTDLYAMRTRVKNWFPHPKQTLRMRVDTDLA